MDSSTLKCWTATNFCAKSCKVWLCSCIFKVMKRFTPRMVLAASLFSTVMGQGKPYPQPQTPSAAGQPAPDFNLRDANGNPFALSAQRGSWVLLYFYRGYW